jgi:hypothetical protein
MPFCMTALGCRMQPRLPDDGVVVAADSDAKWHDVGPVDPVKAILIMNE